jgi:hypothetical protein
MRCSLTRRHCDDRVVRLSPDGELDVRTYGVLRVAGEEKPNPDIGHSPSGTPTPWPPMAPRWMHC